MLHTHPKKAPRQTVGISIKVGESRILKDRQPPVRDDVATPWHRAGGDRGEQILHGKGGDDTNTKVVYYGQFLIKKRCY